MNPTHPDKLLEQYCLALSEHFESVQILCSNTDQRGTHSSYNGRGNWFSRQGMARDFIERDQSRTVAAEIGKVVNHPDDDSDAWKHSE